MADRLAVVSLGPLDSDSKPHNFSSELDCLQVPPLDSMFFSDYNGNTGVNLPTELLISGPGFGLDFEDDGDFEFTLDDLDDLYLPSETEDFFLPEGLDQYSGSVESLISPEDQQIHIKSDMGLNSQPSGDGVARDSYSPLLESGSSVELCMQVDNSAKSLPSNSENYNQKCSSTNSCDYNSNASRLSNLPSPEDSCDHELSGGPESSQNSGSGKFDTCASAALLKLSQSSDNYNVTVGQKVRVEETNKPGVPKRRKHQDAESRTTKYRRSLAQIDDGSPPFELGSANEEEEKRKARLMRNRESAQLSRRRKKHYVDELEEKVRMMNSTIADLHTRMSYIMAENAGLRQQLGSNGGICQALPPPGMYPHPPVTSMSCPWMPYPPYVVKQQGSQVPLVPIPKLKPQQPAPAKTKKNEVKKVQSKTKKVASVSLLGLLSFTFLFGVLLPTMNVQDKSTEYHVPLAPSSYHSYSLYDEHKGRVLLEYAHVNESDGNMGTLPGRKFDVSERMPCHIECMRKNKESVPVSSGLGEFTSRENTSEPLVASLYVPRNDKLVKIDGNLIIHSVLASEKAMATRNASEMKNKRETTLAIADGMTPALAIPDVGGNGRRHPNIYRTQGEPHKALTSGSADTLKDHMKSTAADGKLQQWFHEGLAGPLLSSGSCSEVFQFDISPVPASGVIVPASTFSAASLKHRQKNATQTNIGNNRRSLGRLPVPLSNSNFNITEESMGRSSQKDNFQGNKSVSSMVVSVLVDPREAGDGDGDVDGMITPKSFSRIFVVVLLDRVKYVTYSCTLPRSAPHLVTS